MIREMGLLKFPQERKTNENDSLSYGKRSPFEIDFAYRTRDSM